MCKCHIDVFGYLFTYLTEEFCFNNNEFTLIAVQRNCLLTIAAFIFFEIKGTKPESSVSRLNQFKVLVASSTSFLQGCAVCSLDSLSSFSSFPSVITSAGCSENSKTMKQSIQQAMVQISWLQVESVLLGTLN